MKSLVTTWLAKVALVAALVSWAAPLAAEERAAPKRIDFDERLIKGQLAKAGSVYIYDRQEAKIRSLLRLKRSFREAILRTVYSK